MTRATPAPPRIGRLADELTSFVDRRREIAEVKRLLGKHRLLTLTGVGGTGKTRLAVRVAGELHRAFADGVWQVDLAGLTDGALLEHAVADVLGVWAAADVPVRRLLTDYVAGRQALIVLDNCEHLIDACAALISALLSAAPDLRVMCTSRQPLGMIGEALYIVLPLALPGSGDVVDDPTAYSAVELFLERAAGAWPEFALSVGNQALVIDICDRLDGLPLAIELAAAQLRTRSVEQLAGDLVDRFALPAVRHPGPVHHYRLRDAFDWSFDLCTPAERALWSRAAVFCGGGFDLEAVTAICAGPELPADEVPASVTGLIDQSVLVRREVAGRSRYHMLETVREYGLDRLRTLDPAAEVALGRRHRDWYLRLAERFAADWFGARQPELLARLRLEWSNLRTAIDFSLAVPGEAPGALRLTGALLYYWLAGGALREGRHWLDRALAAEDGSTALRAQVLLGYSRILLGSSNQNRDVAEASARESLALARDLDDASLLARAHYALGLCAQIAGQQERARALLEQAVTGFAEAGELSVDLVAARISLAGATLSLGDRTEANLILARCYADCVAHGEQWARSLALQWLAFSELDAGDLDRASGHLEERLRIKRALDDTLGIATSLQMMSAVAAAAGRYERAAHLIGAAEQIRARFGSRVLVSSSRLGTRVEQGKAASRAALGEARYEAAVRLGASAGQDEAIAYALGEQPDLTPRAPAGEDTVDPDPLTRRERQVAELIADGLSNKQIANRLTIGHRTAERHVENILAKLGFRSRTQVAVWVVRQKH